MLEMKFFLINPFKRQPETNRAASASRNLLTEFDSSEDKDEEPPRKAKRTELANIRPLDATPSKSSKKKENNKGKGKGKNKKAKKNNK